LYSVGSGPCEIPANTEVALDVTFILSECKIHVLETNTWFNIMYFYFIDTSSSDVIFRVIAIVNEAILPISEGNIGSIPAGVPYIVSKKFRKEKNFSRMFSSQ